MDKQTTTQLNDLVFHVESFRKLPNPYIAKGKSSDLQDAPQMYIAICDVMDVPDNIPMGTNPREQNFNTGVAKRIRESLLSPSSSNFYILNRGLLLSAKAAHFNNYDNTLTLEMEDSTLHGNVDGGHTYKTILQNRAELTRGMQYVKIEILTGIEGFFEDVADARNTSVQVKDQSIANLRGRFNIIKSVLADEAYYGDIFFEENAEGSIDVCELLAILRMFDIDCYPNSDTFPTTSYNGKAAHVKYYLKQYEEHGEDPANPFVKLQPIMKDIFQLYDKLECSIDRYYREKNPKGKYGSVKGIGIAPDDKPYFSKFSKKPIKYNTPKSFLLPILGSMRALVAEIDGHYEWKSDPYKMMDEVGSALVETTIERSRSLGNNPNATGKDLGNWKTLYQTVLLALFESQNR